MGDGRRMLGGPPSDLLCARTTISDTVSDTFSFFSSGAVEPGAPAESPGLAGKVLGPGPLGREPGACFLCYSLRSDVAVWSRVTVGVGSGREALGGQSLPQCQGSVLPSCPLLSLGVTFAGRGCCQHVAFQGAAQPYPSQAGMCPGVAGKPSSTAFLLWSWARF